MAAGPSWMPSGVLNQFNAEILPRFRIVSYYGSPLTPQMGILGEMPQSKMIDQLKAQAKVYAQIDPSHPVVLALEMVAVVASGDPGANGAYSTQMPYAVIQKELDLARSIGALLILDVQIGHASVQSEVQYLAPFLSQPDVELALDPEFSMPPGDVPGQEFGTMNASAINWASAYLNSLVITDRLPQKVLIVHQFIQSMIPNWNQIVPRPYVALVKDMDGFGGQQIKIANYEYFVKQEAVSCTSGQEATISINANMVNGLFEVNNATMLLLEADLSITNTQPCGGFKVFYRQDRPPMTPWQVLTMLSPPPLVIIYQ